MVKQAKNEYNKTQLQVEKAFEKNIFHRDWFAHYLRWTHVLARVKPHITTLLDIGCGNAELLTTLYRNRYLPAKYVGVDVRPRVIEQNIKNHVYSGINFICHDAC